MQTASHPRPRPPAAHAPQGEGPARAAEGPPESAAGLSAGVRAAERRADRPTGPSLSALGRIPGTGCGPCPRAVWTRRGTDRVAK